MIRLVAHPGGTNEKFILPEDFRSTTLCYAIRGPPPSCSVRFKQQGASPIILLKTQMVSADQMTREEGESVFTREMGMHLRVSERASCDPVGSGNPQGVSSCEKAYIFKVHPLRGSGHSPN